MKRFVLMFVFGIFFLPGTSLLAQDSEKENYFLLGENAKTEMLVHYNKRRYQEAIASNIKREAYFFKAEAWEEFVLASNDRAFLYNAVDDLKSYKEAVFRNFELAEKYLETDHPEWLRAKEQINTYYYRIGDYKNSLDILKEVIPLKEKLELSNAEISRSYFSLGTAYNKMKDYENALSSFKKSITVLYPDGDLGLRSGERFNNIARVFQVKGELDSALYYLNQSEALFENIDVNSSFRRKKVETYFLLLDTWLDKKEYDKAKFYLTQAKKWNLNNREQVIWNERFAKYYREVNEYKNSKASILKAIELAEEFDAANSPPMKARRTIELAKLYSINGQEEEALDALQKGLLTLSPSFEKNNIHDNPLSEQLLDKPDALIILQDKARILFDKYVENDSLNYLKSAFRTYLVACDVIKGVRQGIRSADSKNVLSERTVSVYEEAIESAFTLFNATNDATYLHTAFQLAESNKAQLLLESLNEQEAIGFAGIPDSLSEKEKDLRLYLAALEDKLIREGRASQHDDDVFKVRQELSQFSSVLEKSYPRYFKLKYNNETIDPSFVQEHLLDESTALIEYFVGVEKIFVFVITKDDFSMDQLNKGPTEMEQISKLRNILKNSPGKMSPEEEYTAFVSASRSVYDSFVKISTDRLPENINTLIIIPDDKINFIPFEVLLLEDPEGGSGYSLNAQSYLFEDYSVNYNYSATLLNKVISKEASAFEANFIGYAPTFTGTSTNESRPFTNFILSNLKCNKDEVSTIESVIGGEKRMDKEASKDNFLNEVKDYKIIHLATHAFVNQNDSKLNRIFLQDDYLTDVNLYNLELNTELAVLSACNTGSGELLKGEGVMNLARGFMNAGCSSTLMSMWSVDDCTTADLMLLFYKEIKNGLPKDEALRRAKIEYLNSANKTKLHPYYWAAFVPFGDMKPMDLKGNYILEAILPIGLIIAIFFLFIFYFKKRNGEVKV